MPTWMGDHPDPMSLPSWADQGFGVRSAQWAHPRKGHDRLLLHDHFAAVADGATPLGPDWPDPGPFAEAALRELSRFAVPGTAVGDVFAAAIQSTSTAADAERSTCAVAAAWLDGTHVTVCVLGDCLALVETSDAVLILPSDPDLARLDDHALSLPPEDRLEEWRRNRALANTRAGYWIYGTQIEAAHHVRWTTIPVADVRSILLCTDGLRRVPALNDDVIEQLAAADGEGLIRDVLGSVQTRVLDGRPVDGADDEAAVLVGRMNTTWDSVTQRSSA